MKILHIITGLSTGGAERALYNVLAGGLAQRFDSAVLSLRDEGTMGQKLRDLGVPVYTLDMRSGVPTPAALLRLRRTVKQFQPDLLQGWMYHGNLAADIAARWVADDVSVAWNVRHSLYDISSEKPLTRLVIRANRRLSHKPDTLIYNSRVSCDLHTQFGFADARAQVIPNGFDVDRLVPDANSRARIRNELTIPETALVVGHVARFHPMKDHAGFLHAAVDVARQMPSARFLLVGRNVNLANPALAGIVPADLQERFIFTGERSDVPDLMRVLDVFCLSSSSEAFPNVLGEAMACGVPCVTTDVGDGAAIVGKTGWVVPPQQPGELTQALLQVLSMQADDRRALGMAARERVCANYSLHSVVNQYAAVYESVNSIITER